jgi:GT2 family glycosyltransferase
MTSSPACPEGVLAPVAAVVINYGGAADLPACLGSLRGQTRPPREIVVVDNRSPDDSVTLLRARFPDVRLVPLDRNLGYAGGANVGIRETSAPYVLLLNPDVVLEPDFLAALIDCAERRTDAGSFTGKLLRPPGPTGPRIIDSTGHVLFRSRWIANRGEGEADTGRYDEPGEVFGVSGAAPLYRRAMLDDVRVDGEVFAESFFVYLEDVDLDWRARLLGWKALYVPTAVARHERGQKGGARRPDPAILRHSLKNRYLLMLRNDRLRDVLQDAWAILPLEPVRILDFLVTAPRSLGGGLDLLRLLPATLRQRRAIRRRVRISRREFRRWLRPVPDRGTVLERARLLWSRSGSD